MISLENEYLLRVRNLMKDRRVAMKMKQTEASDRSGVNLGTLRLFEQSGKISFYNLLKLMVLYKIDKQVINSMEDRASWTLEEIIRSETKKTVR